MHVKTHISYWTNDGRIAAIRHQYLYVVTGTRLFRIHICTGVLNEIAVPDPGGSFSFTGVAIGGQ